MACVTFSFDLRIKEKKLIVATVERNTMPGERLLRLADTEVILHHSGAVHLPEFKCLIVSDLHAGKATHFSNSGIPVPPLVEKNNFRKLSAVIERFKPAHVIFLGDLFHSKINSSWAQLTHFLHNYPEMEYTLVLGNHDVFDPDIYLNAGFEIHNELLIGSLMLTHEPLNEGTFSGLINICGHIHPAIRLSSRVHRSVVLPCFHYTKNNLVLPAFGTFTGIKIIRPSAGDSLIAIANDKLVEID